MPLNTAALSRDVLSNKLGLLKNFSKFCAATASFLEAITSEETCSEYRNTLAAGAERDGFDHKVKFVRQFAAILKQGSSLQLLWNLNSVIKEAAGLKTYLVKISQTNRGIKRRFFEKNIEAFQEFCRSLESLITLSDDSKKSLEYVIGGSALEEIQFQEDLIGLADDPSLELIRKANKGDQAAIGKLRGFFNATEFSEKTAVLVNGKLSTSEAALAFIANSDPAKAFSDITQAVKIVKCSSREDYLNLCNNALKLALNDSSAEIERQIIELTTSAKQTKTIALNANLFVSMRSLRNKLNKLAKSAREKLREETIKLKRFSPALEDLSNNDLPGFLSRFKGEFMLELFCLQFQLDKTNTAHLLADFRTHQSTSLLSQAWRNLLGYKNQATDLLTKAEPLYQTAVEKCRQLEASKKKLDALDLALFKLNLQSQGSLDALIVLLTRFTAKDRPLFQSKQSYDSFLVDRDELVTALRKFSTESKPKKTDCSKELGSFSTRYLQKGFCLFGGQYRTNRLALMKQLRRPILPSKSSLKLGH